MPGTQTNGRRTVTNADLFFKLGVIEAEQKHGTESRARIHETLEKQGELLNDAIATLRTVTVTAQLTNELAVKTREKVDALEPVVKDGQKFQIDAEPLVSAMRSIRNWVRALAVLIGVMGLSVSAIAVFAKELLAWGIKAWLGL